jgi:hypothetical protein
LESLENQTCFQWSDDEQRSSSQKKLEEDCHKYDGEAFCAHQPDKDRAL